MAEILDSEPALVPRVAMRPCIEGGCLKTPRYVADMYVENGRVMWPIHYRSNDFAHFTTGSPAARRDLKFTSVLEVIRAARDNKAATLNPDGEPEEEEHRGDVDTSREALLSMVAGDPPSKLRRMRSRVARDKRADDAARQLYATGSVMTIVVPASRGSEETVTLSVLMEKSAQVTLEVTPESLTWLHQWVQAEVRASAETQRPTKAHGQVQCMTNGICWSQRRRGWIVSYSPSGDAPLKQKHFKVNCNPDDENFDAARRDALEEATQWRYLNHVTAASS